MAEIRTAIREVAENMFLNKTGRAKFCMACSWWYKRGNTSGIVSSGIVGSGSSYFSNEGIKLGWIPW